MAKGKKSGKKQTHSVEKLIEQANLALSRMEPDLATKFFEAALKEDSLNTNIMDALADTLLQTGEKERALQLLLESTKIAPELNPVKWLYLGQLEQSSAALECYRTAIKLLEKAVEGSNDVDETVKSAYRQQISKAYCSIADLYMTDLCFEQNAETECSLAVEACLKWDSHSIDGFQTMASLRLSQCRNDEAAEIMTRVGNKILQAHKQYQEKSLTQVMQEDSSSEDVPSIDFSIATAKLLLECAPFRKGLNEMAKELTELLIDEEEDIIEIWFLHGLACMALEDHETALDSMQTAKHMMDALREHWMEERRANSTMSAEVGAFPYECQYGLVTEHIEKLGSLIQEGNNGVRPQENSEPAKESTLEEEWSDNEKDDAQMIVE